MTNLGLLLCTVVTNPELMVPACPDEVHLQESLVGMVGTQDGIWQGT